MKLNAQQILSCARGVAYMTETDGYVRLHRFTKAQEDWFEGFNQEHFDRSFATAGIVLEFDTDSQSLSLAVRCRKGSSRHWFVHSIFVDGNRIGQLRGKFTPPEYVSAEDSWELGEGTKRVKIVFPWSAGSEIRSLELSDGATFVPLKKEKRVLIYGDSITHGYDAALPENSYAYQLAEYLDADCINKAIGGAVFRSKLAELADDLTPALITTAYGTNDWSGAQNPHFEEEALAFIRQLRKNYPDTPIIMLAPVWRRNWTAEKPVVQFRQIPELFARIAEQVDNVQVVDCFEFIPHDPANYSPDVLHPNDQGFSHYAGNLLKVLDNIL